MTWTLGVVFRREVLRELAALEPARPVLSVYARTDPRDSGNTTGNAEWRIRLRNGLAAVGERLEAGYSREDRLAFRELRGHVESQLGSLPTGSLGRSLAWFLTADGETLHRFTLQLPVRDDAVVWDSKPFVSLLVDVADRGAPVGVIVADSESVRLLQLEQGEVTEPDNSTYELSLGDWRPFGGSAGGTPSRGVQTTSHQEHYDARVDKQRGRLFGQAATETAHRLDELGWERLVVAADGQIAAEFEAALPAALESKVVATVHHNAGVSDNVAIADAFEPVVEKLWMAEVAQVVDSAHEHALAGGAATLGAQETLGALAEGRVQHLVLDPAHDFSAAAGMIPATIGGPPELLGERAVEAAIASGADVSALSTGASERLAEAGGIAALLRY